MKLNNKGFAISVLLYSIATIAMVVFLLIISVNASNVRNTFDLSSVIKRQVSVDVARPVISINPSIPIWIIKGDSYAILGSYSATGSNPKLECKSNINGVVTNTSTLNEGVHDLTCTITNEGGKAVSTTRKLVVYKEYTIKNLFVDGSFESNISNYGCYNSCPTISSNYKLYGNSSINVKPTMGVTEIAAMPKTPISIVSGHVYYLRVNTNYVSFTQGSRVAMHVSGLGWVIASINSGWQVSSDIFTSSTTTSVSDVRVGKCFDSTIEIFDAYFDGAMIVDLTDTFGSGNEPTKEWCDAHIKYFEGTSKINK